MVTEWFPWQKNGKKCGKMMKNDDKPWEKWVNIWYNHRRNDDEPLPFGSNMFERISHIVRLPICPKMLKGYDW
jgi:hypothetical protein